MNGPRIGRGDIVLSHFPFTDLSDVRIRPGLIVTAHAVGPDYVFVFISSVIPPRPRRFDFILRPGHPEFSMTGLRLPSVFRADKVVTLHEILLARRLGRVGPRTQAEVDTRLCRALGL